MLIELYATAEGDFVQVFGRRHHDRARLLGETMRAEDGVAAALTAFQRIVAD